MVKAIVKRCVNGYSQTWHEARAVLIALAIKLAPPARSGAYGSRFQRHEARDYWLQGSLVSAST